MTTAVLITGTSSGIGQATVQRLSRDPQLTVFATASRLSSIADLAAPGARVLDLDVTDEDSMRNAVLSIEAEQGSVGVLINNAGYGEYGSIEEVDLDKVRREFETNVFGLARLTQLVLPAMRAAGQGRIVNVGSMGGRLTFPMGGYYHASKYAVEAISDALRYEVAPFGIKVSLIEPGIIRTGFSDVAASSLSTSGTPQGPYSALSRAVDKQLAGAYRSGLIAVGPDAVARAIERAVTAAHPRPRTVVTPAGKSLVHLRRLLGTRAWDALLRQQYRAAPVTGSRPSLDHPQ